MLPEFPTWYQYLLPGIYPQHLWYPDTPNQCWVSFCPPYSPCRTKSWTMDFGRKVITSHYSDVSRVSLSPWMGHTVNIVHEVYRVLPSVAESASASGAQGHDDSRLLSRAAETCASAFRYVFGLSSEMHSAV